MAFRTRQQKPQVPVAPIDQTLPQPKPGRQRGNWRPSSFHGENSRFVKSHNAPVAQATRIGLSIRRFAPATPLARKMLKDWWAQFTRRRQHRKTNQKLKVIMSLLTPIQPNGATRELEGNLPSSQLELKAAPDVP